MTKVRIALLTGGLALSGIASWLFTQSRFFIALAVAVAGLWFVYLGIRFRQLQPKFRRWIINDATAFTIIASIAATLLSLAGWCGSQVFGPCLTSFSLGCTGWTVLGAVTGLLGLMTVAIAIAWLFSEEISRKFTKWYERGPYLDR